MIYDVNGNEIFQENGIVANVKEYGARGDGLHDDASAIQDALDALSETGGTIFFPSGVYMIGSILYFYANQNLIGNNAVLKKNSNITAIITSHGDTTITVYNGVHDCVFDGLTFDGVSGTATLLSFCHAKNITVRNCSFVHAGGYHELEINSSKYVTVEGCNFDGSGQTSSSAESVQIDTFASDGNFPWGNGAADGTRCKYVNIINCNFYANEESADFGNHAGGGSYIEVSGCTFDGNSSGRAAVSFGSTAEYVNVHDNRFFECTSAISATLTPQKVTFHDNIITDVTTPIASEDIVAYNNLIDGTLT